MKFNKLAVLSMTIATSLSFASAAMADLPSSGSVINLICPYGAGGTADAICRKYAEVANKVQDDYTFIVENQTGGDGFEACTNYSEEDPDTTDLLNLGYGACYRHDLGKKYDTEIVDWDRDAMYPIASIDDRTWILYTTPDQTFESILEKAKTEGIKMSGGNPLSDPHLALGSLLTNIGGTVMVVPYDGGAEQRQGLISGEVDVFVGSTQAGQEDVEAGTIIPILAFSENTFEGFTGPDGAISVPSCAGDSKAVELPEDIDFSNSILPGGGFVATRVGADQEWIDYNIELAKNVWADSDYYEWIDSILLNNYQIYGEEAQTHLDEACEKAITAYELLSGETE